MPTSNIFTWRDGAGWLVLSGGNDVAGEVRAMALERIAADGALVCVSFGGDADDAVLDDLQDLGAPSGYLVDVLAEDDKTVRDRIGGAAMVVLRQNTAPSHVRSNLMGAAIDGIVTAYERGAVVLAEGTAASVFGTYLDSGEGFGWVERAFVAPGLISVAESAIARRMVAARPDVIVMGVAVGAAMAFGGNGTLETWGNKQVAIVLGNAYTSD